MSPDGLAAQVHAGAQTLLKAVVVGPDVQRQASTGAGEVGQAFAEAGALEPPYEPESLCLLFEHSNALRQNVDAYATNIDGLGYRLEPAIDFDAEDADQRVAECLYLERVAELASAAAPTDAEPTAEDIAAKRKELVRVARMERARLTAFFESCSFDCSFVELRRRTRQDLEVTGNAYWEVLRNGKGEVAKLVYVPAQTMRLLPLDPEPVLVEESHRVSPVALERVSVPQRLRRYVQVQFGQRTFFKAFGDRRVVSRKTGQIFASLDDLRRADATDDAATEVLHFALHSPRSPYGVPRWIGVMLSVLGSRAAEEVNYLYFDNKSVPPLALLVSGGRLSEGSIPRIERFIEENLKGRNNFHRVLILEAEGGNPSSGASRARIELRPLTDAQHQDALFLKYDERNVDKVGSAFRLPRLVRGDSSDINRSTSESALRFAEDQVFQPARDEFDFVINRRILVDLGIRFWRFRSQTLVTRDPERMANMVEKLVRVGVLTPAEGRELAGDIFNREFAKLTADWVKRPITLTLAGVQNQCSGRENVADDSDDSGSRAEQQLMLLKDARFLLSLREELAELAPLWWTPRKGVLSSEFRQCSIESHTRIHSRETPFVG